MHGEEEEKEGEKKIRVTHILLRDFVKRLCIATEEKCDMTLTWLVSARDIDWFSGCVFAALSAAVNILNYSCQSD